MSTDEYTDPKLTAQRQYNMKLEDVINRMIEEKATLMRRIRQLEEELNDARSIR